MIYFRNFCGIFDEYGMVIFAEQGLPFTVF